METIKNSQVIPVLEAIAKIEKIKLNGQILKTIVKNKKSLLKAYEELEEVKKKILETHVDAEGKLIEEEANKEWVNVLGIDTDVILDKFNSNLLDQYSDLTLEQYEILSIMAE